MVVSTDIKFYMHRNNNAPQLTNNFGCMISVLNACLVDGIAIGAISSLTCVNKTVTAVFTAIHGLTKYQVIKITGADQAEYNVEVRVLTVPDTTSITFELVALPSVTTATGTISASLPPLGWEKPFSSTSATGGKAAYRSKNALLSSRPYLRVVDELDSAYTSTYAKYAKVGIVEDMADIDTMLGVQAPYNSSNANQNWIGSGSGSSVINGWARWYYAREANAHENVGDAATPSTNNRSWLLVGNGDYFYILPSQTGSGSAFPYGFGNFKSFLNVDTSNTFLASTLAYLAVNATSTIYFYNPIGKTSITEFQLVLSRGYAQAANYKTATCISLQIKDTASYSGAANNIGAYNLTNVAPFAPVFINEDVLRGELPNIYYLFQLRPYVNLQLIEKDGAIYIARNIGASSTEGQIILKIGDL